MKKVNFQNCFRAFLTACCLILLGVVGVNAQSKSGPPSSTTISGGAGGPGGGGGSVLGTADNSIYGIPQGTFQTSQTAQNILMTEMLSIKGSLAQMNNESDPVYIALVRTVRYYTAIHGALQGGQTVPQAIVTGLRIFDGEGLPKPELVSLRNAAIALLD